MFFSFAKLTLKAALRSPGLASGSIPGLGAYSPLDFLRLLRMRRRGQRRDEAAEDIRASAESRPLVLVRV